ncbi:MAG: Glycosyltransferase [uncultured Acidimicrobiales bacterium]|uniref:Glycosyltransferase n=1 Tax=uncultured Acidimicrobiales bacterium TaxID=310071 RepID=A0A6J4HBE7_9ACTN|nr:MAG: Glycosyltransferase [uncultured Acidimicrobiales bacterium]
MRPDSPLRIALLVYRGKAHCGGQGVYTRHLSKALVDLGHHVEVFSGPPYPQLDERVPLHRLESLDLYREPDPFRIPRPREIRDMIDVRELALMCTAGFPEPYTFSLRVRRALAARPHDFDIVHDNQSLGSGLLGVQAPRPDGLGIPVLGTIHHPITIDRKVEIAHAATLRRKLTLRRWYGFTRMQTRVARRLPRIITVSESSLGDIVADHGVRPEQLRVVNVGVDPDLFRPLPHVARVPGRLMTTSSSDVPMKGLVHLLEAVAKVRTERPDVELTVIGKPTPDGSVQRTVDRLDLGDAVHFVSGVSDERLVELYAEAEIAVVPSLYEGFSLPAVEAMATEVALLATTGGAIPEVVGTDGTTAALVPPGDAGALATAILELLADPERRARIGAAGRQRVARRFSWTAAAEGTVAQYREVIALHAGTPGMSASIPAPADPAVADDPTVESC